MFKRLIAWIIGLFTKQKRIPLKHRDVAIVIGHDSLKRGAVSYLGETEHSFNKKIAVKLHDELKGIGISSQALYRPHEQSYSQQVKTIKDLVNEMRCRVVVCLHFNAHEEVVLGSECLIAHGVGSEQLGMEIGDQLLKRLNIKKRHGDGVKHIGKLHNGYDMLKALSNKGRSAVIVEPCFGNTENHDSIAVFQNEDTYVLALSKAIKNHLKTL